MFGNLIEYLFGMHSHTCNVLKHMEIKIMATIQDLKDAAQAEHVEVLGKISDLQAQVQALKDAGTGATPEQLDEVLAAIKNIDVPDPVVVNPVTGGGVTAS